MKQRYLHLTTEGEGEVLSAIRKNEGKGFMGPFEKELGVYLINEKDDKWWEILDVFEKIEDMAGYAVLGELIGIAVMVGVDNAEFFKKEVRRNVQKC